MLWNTDCASLVFLHLPGIPAFSRGVLTGWIQLFLLPGNGSIGALVEEADESVCYRILLDSLLLLNAQTIALVQ